jgi:hypothetical protein
VHKELEIAEITEMMKTTRGETSLAYSCKRHLSVRLLPPNGVAFGILRSRNRNILDFLSIFGVIFAIFRVPDV